MGAHDMNEDAKELWLALGELGDHFSRLGGAARYFNMSESEIPLYIACNLAQRARLPFKAEEYVDPEFAKAAAQVLEKTNKHLNAVKSDGANLVALLGEFITYTDSKLKPGDRGTRWVRFIKWYRAQPTVQPDGHASGGSAG